MVAPLVPPLTALLPLLSPLARPPGERVRRVFTPAPVDRARRAPKAAHHRAASARRAAVPPSLLVAQQRHVALPHDFIQVQRLVLARGVPGGREEGGGWANERERKERPARHPDPHPLLLPLPHLTLADAARGLTPAISTRYHSLSSGQ